MFPRTVVDTLRSWAERSERKPLILRGARQVGKTTAVHLLARDFDHFVNLNLERAEDAELFTRGLPVRDLYQAILLAKNIIPGRGRLLLFLDEIQACTAAVDMLRFFHEDMPELHVIGAGSLLEIELARGGLGFPVGRVEHRFMAPLSFAEFLTAMGDEQGLHAFMEVPVSDYAVPHLMNQFRKYALVGGMPEIVASYAGHGDVTRLNDLVTSLLQSFVDDVGKYARSAAQAPVIRHALETAPLEAGKRITYAGFGKSSYRSREMGEALRTLEQAMLIRLLPATTSMEIPIVPDLKKAPRLQYLDTGLINAVLGLQGHFFKYEDLHAIHQGVIAEHIVGQELLGAAGGTPHRLCFWVREKRNASAEVDFVIQHEGLVIPVEVKAGSSGRLRSLHQFMARSSHPYAVRLYHGPLSLQQISAGNCVEFQLLNLPYCLTSQIPKYLDLLLHRLDQLKG